MKIAAALVGTVLALGVAADASAQRRSPARATAAAAPAGAVHVQPLNYTRRVLPNGLTVYAMRDTSTSNVAVQVWYGVGSKDDPRGRSGFAHLFEHLMFKATRNLPAETFDRLTEDVGGENNAFTADDVTAYHEVVPANHLQRLIWAEAERMGSLVVDQANFASERDVVKEELRQRILAQPYGRLFGLLTSSAAFDVHPYGRPGIGSIEDLDAATVEDVRAFHATYYRPDNATLIVCGNFDPAQLDRWIDQYFGRVQRPSTPLPRVTAVEPQRTAARTVEAYAPNVPLPAVMMLFQTPAASSADTAALLVLDGILTTGDHSRLHDRLVYEQQIATQVFGQPDPHQQPGSYAIGAIMASGHTIAEGERAVAAEIARVRDTPVTAAELSEAQNELITASLRERETVEGRAMALGNAVIIYGDPRAADRQIQRIQAVTPADIQRVARQYLAPERAVTVRYQNAAAGSPQASGTAMPPISTRIQAAALTAPANVPVFALLPEGQREAIPAPAAPLPVVAPTPSVRTLSNGLRVIVAESHEVPLVTAALVVRAGGAADPADRPGASAMTSEMLTQGTRSMTAPQIASAIEALGADLGSSAGWDANQLTLTATRPTFERGMAVLADVALNPAFSAEELERQRQQALDSLNVTMSTPSGLARLVAAPVVYGAAPYGHVRTGTPRSLRALTREDLSRYHARHFRPEDAILVLSGDIRAADGFALAQRLFGGWRGGEGEAISVTETPAPAPRILVVDIPESGQAQVIVGRQAMARNDPRYYNALVASSILGGGYSSRLNREIRIERGLSYGAGGSIDFRRTTGPLLASVSTRNDAAAQVVELVLDNMRRMGTADVTEAELSARRANLIGAYGRRLESTDDTAGVFANLALYDVDLAEASRYTGRVQAVTAADVRRVSSEVLSPDGANIIVVGDARRFLPALRQAHPNVDVIEAAQLNLDSPTLR